MKQLYEIRTVRPIRRPGYPYIGKPTRLYLEMDEVKQFMEYGSVYRIFENSTENPVRVTGEKLSELHNRGISNYVENTDKEENDGNKEKNLQEEESSITNKEDNSSSNQTTDNNVSEKKFDTKPSSNNYNFNKKFNNNKNGKNR